ncbi:MAG TPA: TolC family protein, partial [Candidatus Angelobacter sp.]|nr:TolC family protein [Candidatus Angelobacter sp.]
MKAFPILKTLVSGLALLAAPIVSGQQAGTREPMQHSVSGATPLASLIDEARANNPRIQSAVHAYQAATYKPKQDGALPDTQVMVQHLSVGSPRPFAGYTNSDFAYIGVGGSQEFPYPGKRKARAEVAAREAESLQAQTDSAGREVIGRLK